MSIADTATLRYIRVARKAKDGYNGFLYIHHWATGAQELVFPTHDDAREFVRREIAENRPTEFKS